MSDASSLRRAVAFVAIANLAYFGIEFAVALKIGSVSLFADSIDFLEDASVNLLIFFALAWAAATRARVGMALAAILLIPGIATLWTAWAKITAPHASSQRMSAASPSRLIEKALKSETVSGLRSVLNVARNAAAGGAWMKSMPRASSRRARISPE